MNKDMYLYTYHWDDGKECVCVCVCMFMYICLYVYIYYIFMYIYYMFMYIVYTQVYGAVMHILYAYLLTEKRTYHSTKERSYFYDLYRECDQGLAVRYPHATHLFNRLPWGCLPKRGLGN